MIKSKPFPFKRSHKIGADEQYPNGSFIYKETNSLNEVSIIEYDTEGIIKALTGNPVEDFSILPHLSKEQINILLNVITRNIVEINFSN